MNTNRNFNHPFYPQIEGKKFTKVTGLLREFFLSKGFLEEFNSTLQFVGFPDKFF